ncbi:hypothetical protein BG004_004047 [Podila humilis]|nr:hypothetical protein BG004_004047 [Podila humilis]
MGALDLLCLTSDGDQLYGYATAKITGNESSPLHNILVRTAIDTRPTPISDSTPAFAPHWTLVSARHDPLIHYLHGEFQCTVDSQGVFTIIATNAKADPASLLQLGPKGIQYTPSRFQQDLPEAGEWKNFDMPNYDNNMWTPALKSALFNFQNTTTNIVMHAFLNTSSQLLSVGVMNPERTALVIGATPWSLPVLDHGNPLSIGYAASKLYIFGMFQADGAAEPPMNLVTSIPILVPTADPPTAAKSVYNASDISRVCTGGMQAYSSRELDQGLVIACDSSRDKTTYFHSLKGSTFSPLGKIVDTPFNQTELATLALKNDAWSNSKLGYMIGNTGVYTVLLNNNTTPPLNNNNNTAWANLTAQAPTQVTIPGYGVSTGDERENPFVGSNDDQPDLQLILGASLGSLAVVTGAIVAWCLVRRRRRRRRALQLEEKNDNEEDEKEKEKNKDTLAMGEVKDSTLDDDIPLALDGKQLATDTDNSDLVPLEETKAPFHHYSSSSNSSRNSLSFPTSESTLLSMHPRPQVATIMAPSSSLRVEQHREEHRE